jgi:hypothetical protein
VIARAQLVAAGVGVGAIDYALQRGGLAVVHRGVYLFVFAGAVLTTAAREFAAVLACGEGAALSRGARAASVASARTTRNGGGPVTRSSSTI